MNSKEEKILAFDPNSPAIGNVNLYGLPFTEEESVIVILPVPWEATVSFRKGTARAPKAIRRASMQVDLNDYDFPDGWKHGFFLRKQNKEIRKRNKKVRRMVEEYLDLLEKGNTIETNKQMRKLLTEVNVSGLKLKEWIREKMLGIIDSGKMPALLGGDHSTPLGFMEALALRNNAFGILQIDAHCDLRNAYEGFEYSHASIMFNALKIPEVKKLVQVGIRDYCLEEAELIKNSRGRVVAFFDAEMKREMYVGENWKTICRKIVELLPLNVYISFDIDGLDPKLCPNTGTPVAGGLEFEQATSLLLEVMKSGKKIIGFDLNEVAPGDIENPGVSWDANVGARMLFKLCNLMAASNEQTRSSEKSNSIRELVGEEKESAD